MTEAIALTGRVLALRYLIGDLATTEELRLKLFTNDITPDEDTVTGDLTEATFTGYASVLLSDWTLTDASAVNAQVDFVSTADQTAQSLYGYYIVRSTSNELILARRFTGGPYTMANNGDALAVTPTIEIGSSS